MSSTLIVAGLALVLLAALLFAAARPRAVKPYERFEDDYNCQQEWATCPNGPPFCYWGDKDYNRGKCCPKPWSLPQDCQDPVAIQAAAAAPPTDKPSMLDKILN